MSVISEHPIIIQVIKYCFHKISNDLIFINVLLELDNSVVSDNFSLNISPF